jgi:hypothetical protein
MKPFEIEMRERAETEYEEYDNRESYKLGAMHALKSEMVRELIACMRRQIESDDACGHPFNEDMSAVLAAYESAVSKRREGLSQT